MELNFECMDGMISWKYKEDKLKIANDLGYKYITEALHDLYFNRQKDFNDIVPVFEYGSAVALRYVFKKLGWQHRILPKGGFRCYNKLFQYKEIIKKAFKSTNKTRREFYREQAKIYSVHEETIAALITGRTWKENGNEKDQRSITGNV